MDSTQRDPVLVGVRRSEQVWWEQICQWESLDYGVAFTCEAYPTLAEAQQLRDVWLASISGEEAFDRAEAHFAERGLTCHVWSPATGQAIEPVAALMAARGWRAEFLTALGLDPRDIATNGATDLSGVRVLPARAMRRAYREFLDALHDGDDAAAEAGMDRLDDASYEVLLAVRDGSAVGRIGYHDIGEIARLRDFSIQMDVGGDAIESLLMAHVLHRARRLVPRAVVACVADDASQRLAFLKSHGFTSHGSITQFRRPA